MARRSKKASFSGRRGILNSLTANPRLPARLSVRSTNQLLLDNARLFGHDNRAYNPLPKNLRPARLVSGRNTFQVVSKTKPLARLQYQFALPKQTVVCVRRKTRKEVLHARKKTGRGVRRRNPRRNQWSNIHC